MSARRVLFSLAGAGAAVATAMDSPSAVQPAERPANTHQQRYTGIPAIPADIGYTKKHETIGGKKESGVVSQAASNPAVILGMALTTAALLGMFKKSFLGDKLGAQRMMQYRIMAQFFTITALVAGVTIFGATYEDEEHQNQKM